MNKIFDGKKESLIIREQLKEYFEKFDVSPTLGIIQVGDDRLSNIFINEKIKFAKYIGVNVELKKFPSGFENLETEIDNYNKDDNIDAFLLQLPLVGIRNSKIYLEKIDYKKDIDCLTGYNYSKVLLGEYKVAPGVFLAFRYIFEKLNIENKVHILIVGEGFVGRLIINYLSLYKFNITIVDKFVGDISKYSKYADVIVFTAGISFLISKNDIKKGAYCINIGASADFSGKVFGGISNDVIDIAGFFVPSVGGIGPMTVAMLFQTLKKFVEGI
ncbi:bifunctional 5,10-methylenetetrahydrofolate dehydrogenase/5,10-methenyltetrahydrofolate cyclohydrolase [Patescibacteria group bacterium]|nr:bifunctional 5,10-methylenetetrahydrofolate dehydrogenase/5,10-methenyltetrahydrofolate cyclohydrolase [Patescibacteria group bacterium]